MRIKTIGLALTALLLLPYAATAATYQIDAVHSSVEFSIRHLVSKTSGRFNDFSGTIDFTEGDWENGTVSVVIKTASINTDNEERDGHLRGPDFFGVEEYPEIRFEGQMTGKTDNGFDVTGKLTLHGVTQEVVMPIEVLGVGMDPWGNHRAGFATELTLNRKDFGINWNKALDQGGLILGEKVSLRIAIEAMRPDEQAKKDEQAKMDEQAKN